MSVERVDKFFEDAEKLILGRNLSKISSEVTKLRSWLQKHQYDVLPDSSKGKLLQILVAYQHYLHSLRDTEEKESFGSSLSSLFADYLQLPEGKLLAAKDKRKVMAWLQSLSSSTPSRVDAALARKPDQGRYVVQDVDEESKTLTLQSAHDDEVWLEGVAVPSPSVWSTIATRFQNGEDNIQVDYDCNSSALDIV